MKICRTLTSRLCLVLPAVIAIETAFAADSPRRETVSVGTDAVVEYVRSCRKANGAFGPFDQEYTDAAWNYPAVHTLRLLAVEIPKKKAILQNGLGYPTGHAGHPAAVDYVKKHIDQWRW